MLQKVFLLSFILFFVLTANAQQYKTMHSATMLHELEKLRVAGSVLYIAAHPDDENTRLLAYLANERKFRTGYLSLTRGDGGQNLIGNEQGIDLGLIRTQELLAARRIDGAEQFFTSAYDFGYSKTSEETFSIWNKQKILADVVWVIRKFKPDIIIARFPEDTRAGHGHHAASGILAREAFYAAADKNQFKEQFAYGVKEWQAKRVLWNTFNFGNNNTINENQLKIDVGQYNALLGESYGEIAARSRSQHKSQGFGVPSQRGTQYEYFVHVAGDTAKEDIQDGINTSLKRYNQFKTRLTENDNSLEQLDNALYTATANYNWLAADNNTTILIDFFKRFKDNKLITDKDYYLQKLQQLILSSIGFYAEATTTNAFAYQGDSLKISFAINSRLKNGVELKNVFYKQRKLAITTTLEKNKNFNTTKAIVLTNDEKLTQPYWLVNVMEKGSFSIKEQQKIGQPDVDYEMVQFVLEIDGELFIVERPIQYKYTDPVKGEIFQPLYIVPSVDVTVSPSVVLNTKKNSNPFEVMVNPKKGLPKSEYHIVGDTRICDTIYRDYVLSDSLSKNVLKSFVITNHTYNKPACGGNLVYSISSKEANVFSNTHLTTINYDHIPTIAYTKKATVKLLYEDVQTTKGLIVGYIVGAGDKVPEALQQLGYTVELLDKEAILKTNLKKYIAIITGIRAYNTNSWMNDVYDKLSSYINSGGNLIVQYNTSNQIGPVKAKISPYNFTISRNRITDENAAVTFTDAKDVVLNTPNKISAKDFNGWVQERTVYEATDVAPEFRKIVTMNDPNEKAQNGGLIIASYGKGNFVYCSLALFRQLPAGVAGAYKLLANIIEIPQNK